jgi:hypothetical protein
MADVVRTRIYLTHIDDWQQVAEAHGEFFRDVRPASTVIQVARLIDPEWLVEIEADAVVESHGANNSMGQTRSMGSIGTCGRRVLEEPWLGFEATSSVVRIFWQKGGMMQQR